MAKTFPTLAVASAATGIGLMDGLKFSTIHEIAEHVLGHPVWTHEMGKGPTTARLHELLYAQFPKLPSHELASSDWSAAAEVATAAYGDKLVVEQGAEERTANPIDTLIEKVGAERVAAIIVAEPSK